jgi:hypothetical protein
MLEDTTETLRSEMQQAKQVSTKFPDPKQLHKKQPGLHQSSLQLMSLLDPHTFELSISKLHGLKNAHGRSTREIRHQHLRSRGMKLVNV